MKGLLTAVVVILSLVLFSCQKEISSELGGSTPPGTGLKLVRIGTRSGSDSITTDFSYSSSNLLSSVYYSGTISNFPVTAQLRIIRNASNIITSTVAKSNIYTSIGIDSIVTNCVYDIANSRYKYEVASYNESGIFTQDSVVYTYSNGQPVYAISYHNDGTGYTPDSKDSVFYSGNNISSEKTYSYNGSGFDLDQETNYDQYDNNVNPLHFPADAPILGMTSYYSTNNVVKRTIVDYTSGSSATAIFTYSYNSGNRPTKAVSTDGTNTSVSSYYYQ